LTSNPCAEVRLLPGPWQTSLDLRIFPANKDDANEDYADIFAVIRAYHSAIVVRIAASLIATAVLALGVVAGGSSATRVRDLQVWARLPWNPPVGVTTHGYSHPLLVAKHVPPGMYRISILATEALGFELIGPGINRRTKTCLGGAGSVPCWQRLFVPANTSWTGVRLSRGTYKYRAVGPGVSSLRPRPTSGSFHVP
jgi:hypothetical protein